MVENLPKVSIIIPTLNEERYLPRLLEAIKKQGYRLVEVIVADWNSKDRTVSIARGAGCRVVECKMAGIGHARNVGAAAAEGGILFFLDADVVLPTGALKKIVKGFQKRNLGIATCTMIPISKKIADKILHGVANRIMIVMQFTPWPYIPGFCILVKRSVHKKIGGFDEMLKLAEDHDYVIRARKYGKFRVLADVKIYVSTRRLEKEGRLRLIGKYFFSEIYRVFGGKIKKDIFKYEFGEHK